MEDFGGEIVEFVGHDEREQGDGDDKKSFAAKLLREINAKWQNNIHQKKCGKAEE